MLVQSYNSSGDCIMKVLTIRRVHKRLADALDRETRRRRTSLNQTVLDLLEQGLGVGSVPVRRRNGLARLAGTWSVEEQDAFTRRLEPTEQIDPELWH